MAGTAAIILANSGSRAHIALVAVDYRRYDLATGARFWAKVDKNGPIHPKLGSRCWLWTGLARRGYGQFRIGGRRVPAHRVAYELTTFYVLGPLQIDHRCHRRLCCNPEHLRPATPPLNVQNHNGANRNNKSSGIRGVYWDRDKRKWRAEVVHEGRRYRAGRFGTIEAAETAVKAKRCELLIFNDADRQVA